MRRSARSFPFLALSALVPLSPSWVGCSSGAPPVPAETARSAPAPEPAPRVAARGLVFPDEEFRRTQPPPAPPRPLKLPAVERFQIADALDVYLLTRRALPTVSIDVDFEGGRVDDPPGKTGLASICMSMITEGTRSLDKLAFREALAEVAASVTSYAGSETQGLRLRTLTKHFEPSFTLLRDALLEPGFRQEDFDRLIRRRLDAIEQAKASPASLASRLHGTVRYGPDHPLGRVTTEKTLGAIGLDDCRRHHRTFLRPRGARLFIVGDMTADQVKAEIAPMLAAFRGAPSGRPARPAPRPRTGRIFFAELPGATQSTVRVIQPGPRRTDAAYDATTLMARILGGGFPSRLNMNLREDKGYAYGASGGFRYTREDGTFSAGGRMHGEATRAALLEMLKEIRDLQSGRRPPEEEELERERNGAIASLPARFATAAKILGEYRSLVHHGLPLDYYDSYTDRIAAVTLDDVTAAAHDALQVDGARILVVGDADTPQIVLGQGGEKVPLLDDGGAPVTLRAALEQLLDSEVVGGGSLVVLDADGDARS